MLEKTEYKVYFSVNRKAQVIMLHSVWGARRGRGPKSGSQEATFRAVEAATQKAVGPQGLKGVFETTVDVGGHTVGVSGRVMDGTARVGSFWLP